MNPPPLTAKQNFRIKGINNHNTQNALANDSIMSNISYAEKMRNKR